MQIAELLQKQREKLIQHQIEPREARLLLAFVLGVPIEKLLVCQECSEEQAKTLEELVERRIAGEPYAYLVGKKEFMKQSFLVTSDVLIPREDTEVLVQEVIKRMQEKQDKMLTPCRLLDMCTGSGCIAISLATYLPHTFVTAVDISEKALVVAKKNEELNRTIDAEPITWIHSDLFEKVTGVFDGIVSNPPYITTSEMLTLPKEVLHEPRLALEGGETGMDFYKTIIEKAPQYLKENGLLALEIGATQGHQVSECMEQRGFQEVAIQQDWNGKDRVVLGIWK